MSKEEDNSHIMNSIRNKKEWNHDLYNLNYDIPDNLEQIQQEEKKIGSTGLTKGFLNSAIVSDESEKTGRPNTRE